MRNLFHLILVLSLGLLAVGCGSDRGSMSLQSGEDLIAGVGAYELPSDAVFASATFHVYVDIPSDQQIDIHRATADWDEMTATWNSFGSSFDAMIYNSFMADGTDWRSVDVSDLVAGWLAGDFANFGLVMNQATMAWPRTLFYSREGGSYSPYLVISYTSGGVPMDDIVLPIGDTYVYEAHPDMNYGSIDQLWTGRTGEFDADKHAMVKFDLMVEPPSEEGCTYTKGYWKNWTGLGNGNQADMVTPLLPIWLGNAGGDKSLFVDDVYMAVDVLKEKTYGHSHNGITKLYSQLLAAKLNFANGASDDAVANVVQRADNFLANHDWTDWDDLNRRAKRRVLRAQRILDRYNNGTIGPGHCYSDDDDGCHDD